MAQSSSVQFDETVQMDWKFSEWKKSHKALVAAQSSCTVNLEKNAKVRVRFFLQPVEKTHHASNQLVKTRWYALCAEVMGSPLNNANASIVVKATLEPDSSGQGDREGTIMLGKERCKVVTVIDEFIQLEYYLLDTKGIRYGGSGSYANSTELIVKLTLDVFRLVETGNGDNAKSAASGENQQAEASLMNDLKNMFTSEENFPDLKLDTMDHMTLSAHKFIIGARSPYLRKMIADAVKKDDFNGTLKLKVNGKPLTAILYWIYTGELHENAGRVMEEVVDASIMLELTDLLKVLDKKLISICNKENMFRLYQVAQKNAMPTASDDISTYIRTNI